VLEEVKEDPDLCSIPIIVLSTSGLDEDVADAYGHHVNAYVQKPVDLGELVRIVEGIESFWMSAVRLPPH
jgi:CheY-like chemotaxis protein